ncbi:MAG: hypothetical protein ABIZ81_00360 [Opitutaceae bacterium]
MTHRPVFHPRIEADVREEMGRYEELSPGLGERFKRTVYATVDEILVLPEKNAVKAGAGIRTRLTRPFPDLIFDAVERETVFVLTVHYAGRKPAILRAVARERRKN